MTAAQIVASSSDHALQGIIRQLTQARQWPERLQAALREQRPRKQNPKPTTHQP